MSKEKGKTQNKKRKLTRQEKKQIDALIRQSKGDGKPHTAQDSIPFERMYKDGICRLANGRYSKCIEFEDINYQLAQPDDKTAIFEALCDMYTGQRQQPRKRQQRQTPISSIKRRCMITPPLRTPTRFPVFGKNSALKSSMQRR